MFRNGVDMGPGRTGRHTADRLSGTTVWPVNPSAYSSAARQSRRVRQAERELGKNAPAPLATAGGSTQRSTVR